MKRTIKHIPLHPPRACTPLEGVYLRLWQNFAEQRPEEWVQIFSDTITKPRQRAASVAASFMVFMGCNGGAGFTRHAEDLARTGVFRARENAYLAAWAMDNQRCHFINHGLRTIEYMLAREHPIEVSWRGARPKWEAVPTITMDDVDVIECMVVWWSGPTARTIRELAEAHDKVRLADERLRRGLGVPA